MTYARFRILFCNVSGILVGAFVFVRPLPVVAVEVVEVDVRTAIAQLESEDANIRTRAATLLGELGPDACAAGPALVKVMAKSGETDLYGLYYADALRRIGPCVISPIESGLQSANAECRDALLRVLRSFGEKALPAVPTLIGLMDTEESTTTLCMTIHAVGADALPGLIAAAESRSPRIRENVADCIGGFEISASDGSTVDALLLLVSDEDHLVRIKAFRALQKIGSYGSTAVPRLIEHLMSVSSYGEAENVGATLGAMGGSGCDVLERHAADSNGLIRVAVAVGIADCGESRVGVERQLLQDRDPMVRLRAVEAISSIGGQGMISAAEILSLFGDASSDVRASAAVALAELGLANADCIPQLVALLADVDVRVRTSAMYALSTMGPDARGALEAILGVARRGSEADRASAAIVLGSMGACTTPVIDTLVAQLRAESSRTREETTELLDRLARAFLEGQSHAMGFLFGARCEPEGIQLIWQAWPYAARNAIVRIGPPAVPTLVQYLDGEGGDSTLAIREVLVQMGESVLPQLEDLRGDVGPSGKAKIDHLIDEIRGKKKKP